MFRGISNPFSPVKSWSRLC